MELANLPSVKAASRRCGGGLRPALTRKFCQLFGKLPEDTKPDWQKGGDSCMRPYAVYIFVPTLKIIEAKDEADLLAKIGERYQELYKQAHPELIEPLPIPEDFE
jgi:hypothetical protein